MEEGFQFADEFGPAKVIHIYQPRTGLKAILVVDNVAAGPSIGGVRMAPDVSLLECFRLARAMTLKNAAAGLAHGGGKAVIFDDPAAHAGARGRYRPRSPVAWPTPARRDRPPPVPPGR